MNRRLVLKNLLLYTSLSNLYNGFPISEYSQKKLKKFGLQLSTITASMATDFEGTLAKVASIGYRQVEFSALGFLGREVLEVKDLLAKNRLSAPVGRVAFNVPPAFMSMPRDQQVKVFGSQSSLNSLKERIKTSISDCKVLGQKYLIIPAIMPHIFSDMSQVKDMIGSLRESGQRCRDHGILLGYHNHNWEFEEVDGVVPYEIMLQELDPDYFTFQLDSYWVRKANKDLQEILTDYAGRFITCHLKDIDAEGDFEDVGHGQIDFPGFIRKAKKQGAKYFFVERDTSDAPLESIKRSFQFLKDMKF